MLDISIKAAPAAPLPWQSSCRVLGGRGLCWCWPGPCVLGLAQRAGCCDDAYRGTKDHNGRTRTCARSYGANDRN